MKNKDGFISMTLVYTFLIVFMFIMLAIINSYIQKNHFLETLDEKINVELKGFMQTEDTILNRLLKDNIVLSSENINLSEAATTSGFYYIDPKKLGISGLSKEDLDENNDGKSNRMYFFRGESVNNFIIVNNLCFRIMRTNENGSIRLIYYNNSNTCEGDATPIGEFVSYNNAYNSNAYVGYMFGSPEGTTFENTHQNEDDTKEKTEYTSSVKKYIDDWYSRETFNSIHTKISDAIYCNRREITSGTGIGTTTTDYDYENFTFNCKNEIDRFELHNFSGGKSTQSNSLEYGVALPIYSDLIIAGSGAGTSYLNYEYEYWLMTPVGYDTTNGAKVLSFNGTDSTFNNTVVTEFKHVFPVISLKSSVNIIGGSGEQNNPYIIG